MNCTEVYEGQGFNRRLKCCLPQTHLFAPSDASLESSVLHNYVVVLREFDVVEIILLNERFHIVQQLNSFHPFVENSDILYENELKLSSSHW